MGRDISRRSFLKGVFAAAVCLGSGCNSKQSTNQIVPVYLSSGHSWFHIAVWHALTKKYLKYEDLENMQLDCYDNHKDWGIVSLKTEEQYLRARKLHNKTQNELEKILNDEILGMSKSIFINNFHTLGAYEGFFSEFNWYFNKWAGIPTEKKQDAVYKKDKTIYVSKPIDKDGTNIVKFNYSQHTIKNIPPKNKNYIVTIEPDFFSLCNFQIPDLATEPNNVDEITKYFSILVKNCNEKNNHIMSDEEFERRDEIMREFVEKNFKKDMPPKLTHICESPLYCPRQHSAGLIISFRNAFKEFYSDYNIQTFDLRQLEIKTDIISRIAHNAVEMN